MAKTRILIGFLIKRHANRKPSGALGGRGKRPKNRVFLREVVHSTGQAADGPLPDEPVKSNIHRLAAADFEEIRRDKDNPTSTAANGRNDPGINGLW